MYNIFDRKRKLKYLIALFFGFIFAFLVRPFRRKSVILIGGNMGQSFDDNSKYMYLYTKNNHNYVTYWCQNDRTKQSKKIDRFLVIGSVKAYLFYFLSDYVFFSHSVSTDICPIASRVPFLQPFRTYLSHGVEGFKKRMNVRLEKAEFYPCTNAFEYKIKKNDWKVATDKLKITGIARYDGLDINRNKRVKKILYMPTWREWDYMLSEQEFKKTALYKTIVEISQNKVLNDTLNETGSQLIIRLHPFFFNYEKLVSDLHGCDNILFSDAPIGTLEKECDMLITDYSSLAWDFLFSLKPVIFYQFDLKKYMKSRGSYLQMPGELFGPSVKDVHDLIKEVSKVLHIDVDYRRKLQQAKSEFFDFFDKNNCKRILEAAIAMRES